MERLTDRMSMLSDQIKELRQAAKWFDKACFPDGVRLANEAADTIESLSAKLRVVDMERHYSGGWIPCSERLPEEYGDYLVAWRPLYMTAEDIVKKVGREVPHFYEIVEYDPDDEALWIGGIEQAMGEYEITAWRELPEPYHEP